MKFFFVLFFTIKTRKCEALGFDKCVRICYIIHSYVETGKSVSSYKMIKLTDNAIERLHKIADKNNKRYVRLSIKGGGCAEYEYEWV